MAESQTIARPYAKAVLGRAVNEEQQKQWQLFLQTAASLIAHPDVAKRLNLPHFVDEWTEWLNQTLLTSRQQGLNQEERNFLNILKEQNRLMVLPEISDLYEQFLLNQSKKCLVSIESAQELKSNELEALQATLSKKIGRDVLLKTSVNPELIAGVRIEYDGQVIDQTMKGRIAAFARLLD